MTASIRTLAVMVTLVALGTVPPAAQVQPRDPGPPLTAPKQQEGFVPIDQLPPQDRLPAAPLLIGAYVFTLAAMSLYLLSIARRLSSVQRDLDRLEDDLKTTGRT